MLAGQRLLFYFKQYLTTFFFKNNLISFCFLFFPPETRNDVYTPRLGRDSGEFDDYDIYYAASPDVDRKTLMRLFS